MRSLFSLGTQPSDPLTTSSRYRDRIYIIKDIILKLVEYGCLNQTSLISFCGLNLKKHRAILDELEFNALISRNETSLGLRTITIYKPTMKGIEFCNRIIEPYEKMFPRQRKQEEELRVNVEQKETMEVGVVVEEGTNNVKSRYEYHNLTGKNQLSTVTTLERNSF
jgi:predicted transcriptional regulator